MELHHIIEFVIRKKSIVFEVKRSKGQHKQKVNNLGGISKILNFHPIDLKFEEDFANQVTEFNEQVFFR